MLALHTLLSCYPTPVAAPTRTQQGGAAASPPLSHSPSRPSTAAPSPCRSAYLDAAGGPRPLLAASFSEWVLERRELKFLLSTLDLS